MHAAVVTDVTKPPRWLEFADPLPAANEIVVSVRAAALSPLARGRASGTHYSASGADSFVAGVDGVGLTPDGRRVFFAFPRAPFGTMAERAPVALDNCTLVPDGLDDVTAAALGNPGMSSWVALRERAKFERGESVLINGATGSAGRLAVRIARYLGARAIVVTGRNESQLEALRDSVDEVDSAVVGTGRARNAIRPSATNASRRRYLGLFVGHVGGAARCCDRAKLRGRRRAAHSIRANRRSIGRRYPLAGQRVAFVGGGNHGKRLAQRHQQNADRFDRRDAARSNGRRTHHRYGHGSARRG